MARKKITYDYFTTQTLRKKIEKVLRDAAGEGSHQSKVEVSKVLLEHMVGICKEHEHYEQNFVEGLLQEL